MWPETVRKEDLQIEWYSGTGPGGQHRNKHENCCRMTHTPTGITVNGADYRSRTQNQKLAFKRLAQKLVPLMKQEEIRKRYAAGTERIRTYHEPQDRVTDHRTEFSISYKSVMDGNALSEIIEDLIKKERKAQDG